MIDFGAFSDELVKIAQDPNRKAKLIGGVAGAGAGAAAANKLVGKAPRKARIAAALTGALVGGLGGREVGEAGATIGRGARMTAQQVRYGMQ